MRVCLVLATILAALAAPPVLAEPVSELSHLDLRRLLAAQAAEDPRQAMALAQRTTGGEVLDIRAFQGKAVYYRVLVKNPNGQVVSIVVDAQSGALLEASSSIASNVNAAASSVASESVATAAAPAAAGGKSNADGSAGSNGNAGGNSGNSGNAGGGGAGGNGNAGGNGKGNAGGNGNGRGK